MKNPVNGEPISDSSSKADILNQHFKSVFTVEDRSNIPDKGPSCYPSITDFCITPEGVHKVLSNCNPHKSPGPDAIHPYALKATATEVTPILTHIFQTSLESGTVPAPWKHAYISPVFKKGDKAILKNYRPISLTSVVCKSMEHIIVSQIAKHLQEHSILSNSQFGFRSMHSCESQLFVTLHDITKAVDNKLQVDVAILDFSKAFDKVAHARLLYKLNYYGIRGNLLAWMDSFLHGRSQQVVVDGIKSLACEVTSGVPQGSVIGPTLFINDIVLNVKSEIQLFADDILMYKTIKNSKILQEDLNTLTRWADTWLMEFNIPKCIMFYRHQHVSLKKITY